MNDLFQINPAPPVPDRPDHFAVHYVDCGYDKPGFYMLWRFRYDIRRGYWWAGRRGWVEPRAENVRDYTRWRRRDNAERFLRQLQLPTPILTENTP